jgi:DNA polymerase-3 subunit alpha
MFVHLRTHTEFSIVDGICRIRDLVERAVEDKQPALAITDLNNLFGIVKFYKNALKSGVQPIIGAEVLVRENSRHQQTTSHITGVSHTGLLLLVQNHTGYLNLCELITQAWLQEDVKDVRHAVIHLEWLSKYHEGLIAISGGINSLIGEALLKGNIQQAEKTVGFLAQTFTKRFYIELQRLGNATENHYNQQAIALASKLNLPVVATHPVQFIQPKDFEAHEVRVCVAQGEILGNTKRTRAFTKEQYFKTQSEMETLFADIPSAIENTYLIAKRCHLVLELDQSNLPAFPTPPREDGNPTPIAEHFQAVNQKGLALRLKHLYPEESQRIAVEKKYQERLAFEIETILQMGFPGYFLIVSDFINWARQHHCPVGLGRGSGASSLVAYALRITDLDPLQYKLLFERFLNPERVSMPDFDIDFCQDNRDRVIDYVKSKYGHDAVSQIATFGKMAARAAIRDVGRVMNYPYSFCDGISKLIPNKPGKPVTIEQAIHNEPLLKERFENEEDVRTLIRMAQQLEGITRNVGMHAGGVLISPSKLTHFCPLYRQPGTTAAISQYDKDDIEAMGLVKFDFLGLATLTILEATKTFIQKRYPKQNHFRFEDINLEDSCVYKLFASGKTEAIFQFESRGMQAMLKEANPERLEDLIAMNALYRPGPMDLIPSYIKRKLGHEKVQYPHPLLEEILSETYGIMVYQEQVMQTAQILGNYSLGKADLLRRAMGKKKPEEMAKHRHIFRSGAAKNNIDTQQADEIFDLMEKFAGYGFNKSHAAAYSVLAYQTAWAKVYYPAEFFAANLTTDMGNTDRLKQLIEDAKRFDIHILLPDINSGLPGFEPVDKKTIQYGLAAIKGTGEKAIEAIVEVRQEKAFHSFFDFCVRVDKNKVNKRAIESLIKAGAFDSLHDHRASLLASLDLAMQFAEQQAKHIHQNGLFDISNMVDGHSQKEPQLQEMSPWSLKEKLIYEKGALGFYLSGHLFTEVEQEVRRFIGYSLDTLTQGQSSKSAVGIVETLKFIKNSRGKIAIVKLSDGTKEIEVLINERLLSQYTLQIDEPLIVKGTINHDRFSDGLRLQAEYIWTLADARCQFARYLRIALSSQSVSPPDLIRKIQKLCKDYPVKKETDQDLEKPLGLPVQVLLEHEDTLANLALGKRIQFYPSDNAITAWQEITQNIEIIYEDSTHV